VPRLAVEKEVLSDVKQVEKKDDKTDSLVEKQASAVSMSVSEPVAAPSAPMKAAPSLRTVEKASGAPSASASAARQPDTPSHIKRLGHELKRYQSSSHMQEADNVGVHAELAGDGQDLCKWQLRLTNFDQGTQLGQSAKRFNVEEILLAVTVPDTYPLKPPRVRVVWPFIQGSNFQPFNINFSRLHAVDAIVIFLNYEFYLSRWFCLS